MINTDFRLRAMTLDDLGAAMKLSMAESWNQTENDWRRLIENPENICLAAEWNGQIIGTTTAVNYANRVAWIGMVLVDKGFRRKGVSKSLLAHVFQSLGSCKSVKLDATPEGQPLYKKFGFKDEYHIVRLTNSLWKDLPFSPDAGMEPGPVLTNDIREIIALDELAFGADRARLMESLFSEGPEKAWLLKRNNHITGFALGRDGNGYHQIGPVTSFTLTDARILITKALGKLAGKPIVVDVPGDKEDLLNWFISIGFIRQRHFIRMYKKENPFPGMIDKQYLIAGPEFG